MAGVITERKPFLLLLALLTVNLLLMSSGIRNPDRRSLLQEAVLTVSAPFLKAASWMAQGTAGAWSSYVDLRGLARDNQQLRREVDALAPKARQSDEARMELERLRQILDLRGQLEFPSLAARVIGRGLSGGAQTVLLDRGSRDGIRTHQPVVTPRGVVGRIAQAAGGISKVQVILDPNSAVAALVQRTRAQGVVVGEGDRGCRMEYVSELSNVEVGDVVVTSGLDEIYPKGYIIGVVTEIAEGEGLTQAVKVRPEVDFRRLEEVLVVLKPEGAPARDLR